MVVAKIQTCLCNTCIRNTCTLLLQKLQQRPTFVTNISKYEVLPSKSQQMHTFVAKFKRYTQWFMRYWMKLYITFCSYRNRSSVFHLLEIVSHVCSCSCLLADLKAHHVSFWKSYDVRREREPCEAECWRKNLLRQLQHSQGWACIKVGHHCWWRWNQGPLRGFFRWLLPWSLQHHSQLVQIQGDAKIALFL